MNKMIVKYFSSGKNTSPAAIPFCRAISVSREKALVFNLSGSLKAAGKNLQFIIPDYSVRRSGEMCPAGQV